MALFDHFDCASLPLEDDNLCLSEYSDDAFSDFMDMGEEELFDSRGSAHMDFQFEALETEAHGAIQIQEETKDADLPRSEVEAESVDPGADDFDPPPQEMRQHRQQHRQASDVDVSVMSTQGAPIHTSAQDPQSVCRDQLQSQASGGDASVLSTQGASTRTSAQDPQSVRRDQLQKLAISMRRSEMTRRHVAMQRDALPPEQRRALRAATERLTRQTMQHVQQQQQQRLQDQKRRQEEEHMSRMASFVTNGSFTQGLDQSRRKIGLYMGQVNHGTLPSRVVRYVQNNAISAWGTMPKRMPFTGTPRPPTS